jgi:hypothetical protein
MSKKFSVLVWNIEHFKGGITRMNEIAVYLHHYDPDIFVILETENIDVINLAREHLPDYDYFITDGPQLQEILIGQKRGVFEQIIFSQKREFQVGNDRLRPGALITAVKDGDFYNLLFLHMDSGTDASAFGNRFEMFGKIENLINSIRKKSNGNSRMIVAGDLNTMGMCFPTNTKNNFRVQMEDEIDGFTKIVEKYRMILPAKQFDATWKSSSSRKTSNLDHVIVSEDIALNPLGKTPAGKDFFVAVDGWQQSQSPEEELHYLNNISDHCMMYFEVG